MNLARASCSQLYPTLILLFVFFLYLFIFFCLTLFFCNFRKANALWLSPTSAIPSPAPWLPLHTPYTPHSCCSSPLLFQAPWLHSAEETLLSVAGALALASLLFFTVLCTTSSCICSSALTFGAIKCCHKSRGSRRSGGSWGPGRTYACRENMCSWFRL